MRTPKYRLHKPSGRALIEFDGRRYFLGKHGTAESKKKYREKLAEWAATHNRFRSSTPARNPPGNWPTRSSAKKISAPLWRAI